MNATTQKPIEAKNNEGIFFFQDAEQTTLRGALGLADVTYQCQLVKRDGPGKESYNLEGEDQIGGRVTGIIFREPPSMGASGKPKPEFTGKVDTGSEESVMRFAGWVRHSSKDGKPFLSVTLSTLMKRD